MVGDFLFCFFLAMPAVVAVSKSYEVRSTFSRVVLFWGGWVAIILVAMAVIPIIACDGNLMKGFSGCFGGDGVTQLINQAHPISLLAAKIYILGGVPLGFVVVLLELAYRGKAGAS